MVDDVFLKAIPALLSASTLGLVGWTLRRAGSVFKQFDADYKTLLEAQRNQLKGSIVDRFEQAESHGFITRIELESANRMFESYDRLGGNTYVKALMARMNQMDVRGHLPYEE